MPALLESPSPISKQEEFVEKQIERARQHIRVLDWFSTGLFLLIGSLAFLLVVLLVDRSIETPAGTVWAVVGLYLASAAGFIYVTLYRPSRRQINPFYAARRVETSMAGSKNSVINYVDLKDDEKIPGSVKTAIGVRAAKDLKHVDLNRVLQKRQILWLAGVAAFFFVAALVVALLPPTRTSLALRSPKEGNITILQGEEFHVEVELNGRIPAPAERDHARVRLWFNADDPANFEERPLEPVEGQKRLFSITVPAKQTRNGFHYKLLAGNTQSPDYEVKVRIIPQFTGWSVEYAYPEYKQLEPLKTEDPNLVGYYGTTVTLTAFTNRPVKSGNIEIEGQPEAIAGQLLDDNAEAIRFRFSMLRNSRYRIRFITSDGDKNPDPQRYRMSLIDPKPLYLNYDVTFNYPAYLRFASETVTRKEPHLEAMRGTVVTLLAHANRPVKKAKIEFPGHEKAVEGIVDPAKPMQVKFVLPPLEKDGAYRVELTPATGEADAEPRVFNVRVLSDEKPQVVITKPEQQSVDLPANGTLQVEGEATDDIGIDKMNLRMQLISPGVPKPLAMKPYRGGQSFKRVADGSYPTKIDYKDFVELAKVKPDGAAGAGFELQPDMVIEYWLEAIDNCDVPPGPNHGTSLPKQIRIIAPIQKKPEQVQKEQQQRQQEQQKHEQQQDRKNAQEKREAKQQPQQGDPQQNQQGGKGQPDEQKKDGNPPQEGGAADGDPMPNPQQTPDDPDAKKDDEKVQQALNQNNPNAKGGAGEQNTKPMTPDGKQEEKKTDGSKEPSKNPDSKQEEKKADGGKSPDGKQQEKKADGGKEPLPKAEPKNDGGKGSDMQPNPSPKPEDFKDIADKLKSDDPKEREQAREQIRQSMEEAKKNPPKPQEQQNKIDEHRNKLDDEEKRDFDQAMKDIQKETENLQREERVKNAADKAKSDDPETRQQGQKEIEKELQNQKTRDDVDRQLQQLANDTKDPDKKKKLDDANTLSRNNLKKKDGNGTSEPQPQRKEEEDVDKLAKKLGKENEQEKKDAQEQLEKKLNDPKQHDKVQKQLDDIRNNIKDPQEQKNFDRSMQEMKDKTAKSDPKNQQPLPKPEDIEKFANKLTSDKKEERDQAQKDLENAMKKADGDPASQAQAKEQIDKVRDGIKDEKKKEQFDQAMQKIDNAVQQQRQDQQAKAEKKQKEEVGQLANDLKSGDAGKQKAAQEKLQDMLNDPKKQQAVKDELNKIKKDDPATAKNIDDALKKAEDNLAKKDGKDNPRPKKEDLAQLAKDLNSGDPGKQKAAQEKLQDLLKDPKNQQAVKDELDKVKKDNPDTAKKIDQALRK